MEITDADGEEQYCTVVWEDYSGFAVVPKSSFITLTNDIEKYSLYPIEVNDVQRKAKVLLKGTKTDCELLKYHLEPKHNVSSLASSEAANEECQPTRSSFHEKPGDTLVGRSSLPLPLPQNPTPSNTTEQNSTGDDSAEVIFTKGISLLLSLLTEQSNDRDDPEYHRIQCKGCGANGFKSDRYKCLKCENYDLCAKCFEKRKESRQHRSGHPMAHYKLPNELFGVQYDDADVTLKNLHQKYAEEINENVTCDACMIERFKGLRFKCDTCPDYDLCQQCIDRGRTNKGHKLEHPMIVITTYHLPTIDRKDIEYNEDTDYLGGGAFGKVYKAKWLSKHLIIACKVIHAKAEKAREIEINFLKELAAFRELSGAFILKIYGYTLQKLHNDDVKFMLITEYLDKGSLSSVIHKEKISLRRKVEMASNIASGMRKIHQHDMIHRDIKPDNILVSSNYTTKIGDMGIARVLDTNLQHTQIGPQNFMPPEFYKDEYDQKLDIYTFGLTLNELFTETKHKWNILSGEKTLIKQSPIFSELIARCIDPDPKQRPTAVELEKTLEIYSIGLNKIVSEHHSRYIFSSIEQKNEILMVFYKQLHPHATEAIAAMFPLPPKTQTRTPSTVANRSQTTAKSSESPFCKTQ